MTYVLIVVTVLYTASGVASDTRFQEFHSEAACETARDGIERGVLTVKGTFGREVFAECYSKG